MNREITLYNTSNEVNAEHIKIHKFDTEARLFETPTTSIWVTAPQWRYLVEYIKSNF